MKQIVSEYQNFSFSELLYVVKILEKTIEENEVALLPAPILLREGVWAVLYIFQQFELYIKQEVTSF